MPQFLKNKKVILTISTLILLTVPLLFWVFSGPPEYYDYFKINLDGSFTFADSLSKKEAEVGTSYFVEYDNLNRPVKVQKLFNGEPSMQDYDDTTQYKISYKDGKKEISLFNTDNIPKSDVNSTHKFVISESNGATIIENFDKNGSYIEKYAKAEAIVEGNVMTIKNKTNRSEDDSSVINIIRVEKNNNGFDTKHEYFTPELEPMIGEDGFHKVEFVYDNSDLIETRYFDKNNEPVVAESIGAHLVKIEYDKDGEFQTKRESYYDVDENPYKNFRTQSYSTLISYKNDLPIEFRYLDENDNLINEQYYSAIDQIDYNDKGQKIKFEYFDGNEQYTRVGIGGHTILKFSYDEKGRQTISKRTDAEGNLQADWDDGVAVFKSIYDDEANTITEEFYNENNELFINKDNQAAKIVTKYDKNDNVVSITKKDSADNIINEYEYYVSFPEIVYERDDDGRLKTEKYFNRDGQLANDGYYYAYEYDEFGYKIKSTKLDAKDNLFQGEDSRGVVITLYEYDNAGNKTKEKYFNRNNEPVTSILCKCEQQEFVYQDGLLYSYTYLNADGNKRFGYDGYVTTVLNYDNFGRESKRYYLDKEGNRFGGENEIYGNIWEYNDEGLITKYRFINDKDELFTYKDSGVNGNVFEYNSFGREVLDTFVDIDGNPINIYDTYASKKTIWNDGSTKRVRVEYLDANGNPAFKRDYIGNVVYEEYVYNSDGTLDSIKEFDANGNELRF